MQNNQKRPTPNSKKKKPEMIDRSGGSGSISLKKIFSPNKKDTPLRMKGLVSFPLSEYFPKLMKLYFSLFDYQDHCSLDITKLMNEFSGAKKRRPLFLEPKKQKSSPKPIPTGSLPNPKSPMTPGNQEDEKKSSSISVSPLPEIPEASDKERFLWRQELLQHHQTLENFYFLEIKKRLNNLNLVEFGKVREIHSLFNSFFEEVLEAKRQKFENTIKRDKIEEINTRRLEHQNWCDTQKKLILDTYQVQVKNQIDQRINVEQVESNITLLGNEILELKKNMHYT